MIEKLVRTACCISNKSRFNIYNIARSTSRLTEYDGTLDSSVTPFRINKELQSFFNKLDSDGVFQDLPPQFHTNSGSPDSLLLIDHTICGKIMEALEPYIGNDREVIIFESDPGFGYITKELLRLGCNLRIFESEPTFRDKLAQLKYEYPDRVKIYNRNLVSTWRYITSKYLENKKDISSMFDGLPKYSWIDDAVPFRIIAAFPDLRFITSLLNNIPYDISYIDHGRHEMFIIMPPSLYRKLTAPPTSRWYKSLAILFQITFDITILLNDIPRKSYAPWPGNGNYKRNVCKEFVKDDANILYLVRIRGKKDLYHATKQWELLKPLWIFVKHSITVKHKRIIPALELVVPNIGLRLIEEGFTIYTKFTELKPDEILKLLLLFDEMPESERKLLFDHLENVHSHSSGFKIDSNSKDGIFPMGYEELSKSNA